MSAISKLLANDQSIRLPTPPAVAMRILDEMSHPEPSFSRLIELINTDPALTTRVLRIANSAMMAPMVPIDSIEKAVTRLGTTLLSNIALSFILINSFRSSCAAGFDFDYFWKRAITSAVAANLIAKKICRLNDNIFIAALLHDIGILVAGSHLADYSALFDPQQRNGQPIDTLEQRRFNFTHAELGAELLEKWGLPKQITQPIRFHQQPQLATPEFSCPTRVIDLADKLSAVIHGRPAGEKLKHFYHDLRHYYALSDESIDQLIKEISEKGLQILALYDIPAGELKSPVEILQEANSALSNLNLSTHTLMNQYRQEKEHAQKRRDELSLANAELSQLAFQDSLTGLYNLRYFNDYLDRELQRAARYDSVFSLLLFDIDNFKKINDRLGHQAGDAFLRAMATATLKTVRNTDIVARYGGEEFVVILPETQLQVAEEIAERLRIDIGKLVVPWQGQQISATISIGVSFYCSRNSSLSKQQLIAIADGGLYLSKKSGKNRVSLPDVPPDQA